VHDEPLALVPSQLIRHFPAQQSHALPGDELVEESERDVRLSRRGVLLVVLEISDKALSALELSYQREETSAPAARTEQIG
jgi:hypothetical protein